MLKRPIRSAEQKRADRFDSDLFVLLRIAEHAETPRWLAVRNRLIQARLLVRSMMHPDDVKETE